MTIRLSPLLFVIFYVSFGVFVSVYGPVEYKGYQYDLVVSYVLSFVILFSIGFAIGLSAPIDKSPPLADEHDLLIRRIFRVSLAISALILLFEVARRLAEQGLAIDFFNVGKAYLEAYAGYERNTGSYSLSFILSSLAAAPVFIATVWGLFYFWRLIFIEKILASVLILSIILLYTIGQGKQKQLGDFVVYIAAIFAIKVGARGGLRLRDVGIALSILALSVFSLLFLLEKRYEAINVDYSTVNSKIHPLMAIRLNSAVFDIFGPKLGLSLSIFSQYLSSGYYGLSLGLQQDFTWTWFLGGSYSLSVIFSRWLGFPFMYDLTYPARVGQLTGWDESKWHSIFSWLASDWTYPGALVLLAIVGGVYARVWRESIEYRNPFAILMFCLLNICLVYIPANNQVVHSPGGLATTLVVLGLYLAYGPRFNSSQQPG